MKVVAYKTNEQDTVHVDVFMNDGSPTSMRPNLTVWIGRILAEIKMTDEEEDLIGMFDFASGNYIGVYKFESGAFVSITQHTIAV